MFREVHGLTVTRAHIHTSTLNALSDSGRLKEFHTLEGTVLVTGSTDSTSIIALLPKALETLKVARVDRECAEWVLHAHRENKHVHTQKRLQHTHYSDTSLLYHNQSNDHMIYIKQENK
ncbi:hypothetical protein NEIRO03_2286 [Nematocida sp. AWRm78]|nr:hypothetical protein NEIRO03_2286 [Nematocida sp. AWRm78]